MGERLVHEFQDGSVREIVNPPRVVAGDNALDELGALLTGITGGPGEVLLVVDQALLRNGTSERAVTALDKHGFVVSLFSEITAEPDLALLDSLRSSARTKAYCAVVGLGGGSAMDPAKLAAVFATNDGELASYLAGAPFDRPGLPLVLVPTTAGTGAEASKNSILTHEQRKVVIGGQNLVCRLAILDPTVTLTAPPAVTAASGLDALSHAVETYLSASANTFTAVNSLAATEIIAQWLPVSYADGNNLIARRALLYGAHLAGLAINAVVVLGHTMAYTIATRTHLPHGVTAAMSLPYCLAYNLPAAGPRIEQLAGVVGTECLPTWTRELGDSLKVPPSLTEVGLGAADIPAMVEDCLRLYPRPNNPVPFEPGHLTRLYQQFLSGDLDGALAAHGERQGS